MLFLSFSHFLAYSSVFRSFHDTKLSGGNSFPGIVRIPTKDRLNKIKQVLTEKLTPTLKFDFTKELPDKTTFGDVDVLYLVKKENEKIEGSSTEKKPKTKSKHPVTLLEGLFKPKHMTVHGDVLSFSYPAEEERCSDNVYHQIDMIRCKSEEHYDFMTFYQSYSDVAAILGKLAHHYGLSLGHRGLYLNVLTGTLHKYKQLQEEKVKQTQAICAIGTDSVAQSLSLETVIVGNISVDNSNIIASSAEESNNKRSIEGTIMLSMDPRTICNYFGLSFDDWQRGFTSNTQIFHWLAQSRFFSAKVLTRLNAANRKTMERRPFYRSFVEFLNSNERNDPDIIDGRSDPAVLSDFKRNGLNTLLDYDSRQDWQLEALRYFSKESEMDSLLEKLKQKAERRLKIDALEAETKELEYETS